MSLHRGKTPERIVDLLEIDGGWLTKDGIATDLRTKPETVERALFRLRRAGRVRARQIQRWSEWRAL